jgi:homoserine dehydrogenase
VPHLAFQPDSLSDTLVLPIDAVESAYYLHLRAQDRPGVLADITRILGDLNISIEAILQKEPAEGETDVPVILLTHKVLERNMDQAISQIEALAAVKTEVTRIRLETLR